MKEDLFVGQRFGLWTIIETGIVIESKSRKHSAALVACQCGTVAGVRSYDLKAGRSTACKSCSKSSKTTVESVCKEIWLQYHRSAEKRGYSVGLTLEEFSSLILDNCYYCGKEPSNKANRSSPFYTSGIDRKDNSKDYTIDNSVPCCSICNRGKHVISYEEWMDYLDGLVEYRKNNDKQTA